MYEPCSTWLGRLGLVAWQFLESPEGGRMIAAIGGILVILFHVRRAVPGGRSLAVLFTAIFAVCLLAIVLLAAASWEANAKALCSAYALHRILSLRFFRQNL